MVKWRNMTSTTKAGASPMSTGSSPVDHAVPCHAPVLGHPAWDVALLYPPQGQWSQEQYLALTDHTRWLVEYTAGKIEVLSMPTIEHQMIARFLFLALNTFVETRKLGVVLFCPTRVYVEPEKYREPDLVFNFAAKHAQSGKRYYKGADLVMEVVSDDPASQNRDREQKAIDYSQGGIPEYWIVDPQEKKITVLALQGTTYVEHGIFGEGESATSKLLEGFAVNVTDVFAAAKS
jgi:Uma2 family endonuclease